VQSAKLQFKIQKFAAAANNFEFLTAIFNFEPLTLNFSSAQSPCAFTQIFRASAQFFRAAEQAFRVLE
jgi:hypothetical protein